MADRKCTQTSCIHYIVDIMTNNDDQNIVLGGQCLRIFPGIYFIPAVYSEMTKSPESWLPTNLDPMLTTYRPIFTFILFIVTL